MKIKNDIDANVVGVIIGRFQVPSLHDGHKYLIDSVAAHHKKMLILVGTTPGVLSTRYNPLDFYTRMLMIRAEYPDMMILPLEDTPQDETWSSEIDIKIVSAYGSHVGAIIYGSRDSFIPSYHGVFATTELEPSEHLSGSQIRENISDEVISSEHFRRGAIYSCFNKYPTAYLTVDVIIQDGTKILMGYKKSDGKELWRFPGGFFDPQKDKTLEDAAQREAIEECGAIEIGNPKFIGSTIIDDWRYRKEVDSILTTIFVFDYIFGVPQGSDDLDGVEWLDADTDLTSMIIAQHIPIWIKYKEMKNAR